MRCSLSLVLSFVLVSTGWEGQSDSKMQKEFLYRREEFCELTFAFFQNLQARICLLDPVYSWAAVVSAEAVAELVIGGV